MIKMAATVSEPDEKAILDGEICYLCNIKRKGTPFVRDSKKPIGTYLKELMQSFKKHEFNLRILQVLIETGYCQTALSIVNKSDYPNFLITVLRETDKSFLKESVCKMIIRFFGKQGDDAEGEARSKIEFITLVEPLIHIVQRPKDNGYKLTGLAVMAICNMLNFSEDIKDIFL